MDQTLTSNRVILCGVATQQRIYPLFYSRSFHNESLWKNSMVWSQFGLTARRSSWGLVSALSVSWSLTTAHPFCVMELSSVIVMQKSQTTCCRSFTLAWVHSVCVYQCVLVISKGVVGLRFYWRRVTEAFTKALSFMRPLGSVQMFLEKSRQGLDTSKRKDMSPGRPCFHGNSRCFCKGLSQNPTHRPSVCVSAVLCPLRRKALRREGSPEDRVNSKSKPPLALQLLLAESVG